MSGTIGKRVKELREGRDWKLDDLAKASRMSRAGVWRIESGSVDPRVGSVRKLATALDVTFVLRLGRGMEVQIVTRMEQPQDQVEHLARSIEAEEEGRADGE